MRLIRPFPDLIPDSMVDMYWRTGLYFAIFLVATTANAQISSPASACKNEPFELNGPATGNAPFWDFSEGDLQLTPTFVTGSVNDFAIPVGTALYQANNKWYGFVCSQTNSSIIRLEFGESLQSSPAVHNLGTFSGALKSPQEIEIIEANGLYYGFVFNITSNRLTRLDFGSNLSNTPSATVVLSGSGFTNGGMDVVMDGALWYVVLSNNTTLTIIKLGNSPANIPASSDVFTTSPIAEISAIGDVRCVKEGDNWYAFVVGYSSWTVHRLSFGPSLFANPTSSKLTVTPTAPYGLQHAVDKGRQIILVTTAQGSMLRYDFGSSVTGVPAFTNLGNLGGLTNTLKFDLAYNKSRWYALSSNWNSKNYYLIEFPNATSPFDLGSSTLQSLELKGVSSGVHWFSLYTTNQSGRVERTAKTIEITQNNAPVMDVTTSSLCAGVAAKLSVAADQEIISMNWNLGSFGTSTAKEPIIDFATPGEYPVQVKAAAANGCSNVLKKTITIYDGIDGITDFEFPNVICTNTPVLFENTTVDLYGGHLSYKWFLGDEMISSTRSAQFQFTTPGPKELKLITSLPGCSDSKIKTIPNVGDGPLVKIETSAKCENLLSEFFNRSEGDIASFNWSIDNVISTELNPVVQLSAGIHEAVLTVTGTNGCVSSDAETVNIYKAPVASFEAVSPSVLCEDTFIQFKDFSVAGTSSIVSWNWQFVNDGASNETHPGWTYQQPGTKTVKLKVTNDKLCVSELSKDIVLKPAPTSSINTGSVCIGVPTQLEAQADAQATKWKWIMDGKSYSSRNPSHTFRNAGTYPVSLTVTGNNGCEKTSNENLVVLPAVVPEFEVTKNCVGHEAELTDLTNGADKVVSREWVVQNASAGVETPVKYIFNEEGETSVLLKVLTEKGCRYSTEKSVNIVPAPEAKFSSSSDVASPTTKVIFTNASSHANSYMWQLGSEATSQVTSTSHTFTSLGSHTVTLFASNSEGCTGQFSRHVEVTPENPDVKILSVTTSENPDRSLQLSILIQNEGNTTFTNLPVDVDLGGLMVMREVAEGYIFPGDRYNMVLSYSIQTQHSLKFICASSGVENETSMLNNKNCAQITSDAEELQVLPAYPNPAKGVVTLGWLSVKEEIITVTLVSSTGDKITGGSWNAVTGLNTASIPVEKLQNGVYLVIIKSSAGTKTQRILISN